MSVTVSGVSKFYGTQKALDNVSFEIGKGEIVGFLGPNGAGKSTMMKIVTGYVSADGGHVEVCGHNVQTERQAIRSLIGYLPEQNPLYPDMFVREYLEMVAGMYNISDKRSRVSEMITLTGLDRECHKKIGQLSKGYKQRVGIAQALLCDPEVIILDEPTTGLDPNQILEIRELIKNIGREKTVMLSTHIMQEVEAICDKIIIIDQGTIKATGSTADICSPSKQQCIDVEFDTTPDIGKMTEALGTAQIEKQADNCYRITYTGDNDIRREAFGFAVANNITLLKLSPVKNDIEDIFHKLTSRNA